MSDLPSWILIAVAIVFATWSVVHVLRGPKESQR